jgi:hypothetical protein
MESVKDQPVEILTFIKDNGAEGHFHIKRIPASKGKAFQIVNTKGDENPISIEFKSNNNVRIIIVGMLTIENNEVFSYEIFTQKTDIYFGKLVSISPSI